MSRRRPAKPRRRYLGILFGLALLILAVVSGFLAWYAIDVVENPLATAMLLLVAVIMVGIGFLFIYEAWAILKYTY